MGLEDHSIRDIVAAGFLDFVVLVLNGWKCALLVAQLKYFVGAKVE